MKMSKKILAWMLTTIIVISFCVEKPKAAITKYEEYQGFVYTEYNDSSVIIKNYKGKKKKVSVPSKINDKAVIEVSGLKDAKKLEKLYIPATVECIMISQAPALKKVTISKKNEKYKAKKNLVLNKKGTVVHSCVGTIKNVIIPDTVKKIYHQAFVGARVKTVTFGKKVKTVDTYAFWKCKQLKTVNMNAGTEKICDNAFDGCRKLSKVIINNTKKAPAIGDFAFYHTKKGIKFYVKNETVAKQLKKNLKGTGVVNAKIYVGKELVYDKLTYAGSENV